MSRIIPILLLCLILTLLTSPSHTSPTLSNDQIDEIASLSHEPSQSYENDEIVLRPLRTMSIPKDALAQRENFPVAPRILLLTHPSMTHTHSHFIAQLQEIYTNMQVKMLSELDRIEEYGEYLYEGIVLLLPQTERLTGPVKPKSLLEFIDSGRHVLIASASTAVSDALREISSESALEFDHDNSQLHDYFHTGSLHDGDVFTSQVNKAVIREGIPQPVLYRGMAMMATSSNPLIIPILRGERTSFSNVVGDSLDEKPNCTGEECLLVAAIQGRNGARLTFVAGLDLLSDAFFDAHIKTGTAPAGNKEFSRQLLLWAFGLRGVLRYRNAQSHAEGDKVGKQMYSIFEHVVYSVIVEEFDGVKKQWVPYVANDLQLEFTMLDPYYRIPLKYDPDQKVYEARLQIPDKYGVFKFVVDYRRAGYTPLVFETRQTVRPFRLDQYERFIPAAYPYYVSMFSVMGAFLVMSLMAVYASYDGKGVVSDEKKKQ